jgi:hypothetical protein
LLGAELISFMFLGFTDSRLWDASQVDVLLTLDLLQDPDGFRPLDDEIKDLVSTVLWHSHFQQNTYGDVGAGERSAVILLQEIADHAWAQKGFSPGK